MRHAKQGLSQNNWFNQNLSPRVRVFLIVLFSGVFLVVVLGLC